MGTPDTSAPQDDSRTEQSPLVPPAGEVRLRVRSLLRGITEYPDVDICATDQGITRVIVGDRQEESAPLSAVLEASTTEAEQDAALIGGHGNDAASMLALHYAYEAAREIAQYLRGERDFFSVSLAPASTSPFTMSVHEAISTIPYGQRWTYAELASAVGKPGAMRAVGTACGKNPLPILVPCHRVVRADGTPGHYTGGDAIKVGLLALESGNNEG